ncbi:MAG: hypothetical protein RL479_2451, partial [Verrucomicrobiota bacterium]
MKKYNVAVVGYGWVATAHIPAINATRQARVTAICSSRPLDAAALSAQHGGPVAAFSSYEEMLRQPDIHAVSICSYPREHAAHAIAAARAGKHIILEKPISLTLEDARAVAAAVKAAGVRVCVCFECRFSSQFLATLVRTVPLEHPARRRRHQPPLRGLPRDGRSAALPRRRGRERHQRRHAFQQPYLRPLR